MNEEIKSTLNMLAEASRILAMHGHEDMTLGHIALRDPDGRGVWLKRRGIALSEVMGNEDFILVDFDGVKQAGEGRQHSEWPLHTEIMLARPDINVSGHTHPEFATLLSAFDDKVKLLTQDGLRIPGQVIKRFTATADLVRTREMGRAVADALGNAWAVLLRNHGLSFFARNIPELAFTGIGVERAARAYLRLRASGESLIEPAPEDIPLLSQTSSSETFIDDNWQHLRRRLAAQEGRSLS